MYVQSMCIWKKSKAMVDIILDKRRARKSGKYGVHIRVTYKGIQKYYGCNWDLTEEEFTNTMKPKPLPKYKKLQDELLEKRLKVTGIIEDMKFFSWDELKSKVYNKSIQSFSNKANPVYELFDTLIQNNEEENRVGGADFLMWAKNSLMKFRPNLQFEEIDNRFLKSYEEWFLSQGYSITTVGIYLRALRNVYNTAISKEYKLVDKDLYPFHNNQNRKGYVIPQGHNIKKALSKEQIQLIAEYPLIPGSTEDRARDFWYFTYLNNGINHKDISLLKFSDIYKKQIHFDRAKTSYKNRNKDKIIIASLLYQSQKIIDKWGNNNKDPDNYVFPILLKGISARRSRELQTSHLNAINRHNKKLADTLKLGIPLTTMVARHSFASVMIENGVDLAIIKELMGHSSITTTEIYVKPFNSTTRRKTAELLTAFKKIE